MTQLQRLDGVDLPREKHYRPMSNGQLRAFAVLIAIPFALAAIFLTRYLAAGGPLVSLLMIGGAAGWLVRRRRRMLALVRRNDDAVALLGVDPTTASRILDDLSMRASGFPAVHALIVYNRGVAYLREGNIDRALALFRAALDTDWFERFGPTHVGLLASGIAQAHATRGDVAAAASWARIAHANIGEARRGVLVALDMLIAARTGQWQHVDEVAAAGWALAEAAVPASSMRAIRLVRAFAIANLPPSQERGAMIELMLSGARPPQPHDYRGLAMWWPEYAAFLASAGFGPA
jgi:hypothetical protein